jgi:uncharacterized alpha-E superfamily protein
LAGLLARRLTLAPALSRLELEWLLEIASGTIAYRTRYFDRPRLGAVLQLIVREPKNPRSLAFQCEEIRATFNALSEATASLSPAAFERATAEVVDLDFGSLEGAGYPAVAARQAFAQKLNCIGDAALHLSDRLSMKHFSHTDLDLHTVAA